MKRILTALALLTFLAPALAQDAATAPVAVSESAPIPAIKLDSGIIITPIERNPSDLETMLDVHFWQFHVQAPSSDVFVGTRMEMRVPGQGRRLLGGGQSDFFPKQELDLVFGIAPAIGTSLTTADDWKTSYRRREVSGELGENSSQSNTTQINPVKDLKFQRLRFGDGVEYAEPQTNGDVPLLSFYTISGDDTQGFKETLVAQLVLVVTAKTPQPIK